VVAVSQAAVLVDVAGGVTEPLFAEALLPFSDRSQLAQNGKPGSRQYPG
jgi:hypothetical protein